jgi:hypothetical protein
MSSRCMQHCTCLMKPIQHEAMFVSATLVQQLPVDAWCCYCLSVWCSLATRCLCRQQLVSSLDGVQCGSQQGSPGQLQHVMPPRGSAPP